MRTFLCFAALGLVVGCADAGSSSPGPKQASVSDAPKAKAPAAKPATPKITELDVNALDQLMIKKDAKLAIFDANGKSTREDKGVIPTAALLDSSSEYDLAMLPKEKDTKLVFYCGSTSCSASDTAAERAQTAGYSDVCVLRPGIAGWTEAGKKTVTLADAEKAAKPATEG